jgi:hypothetical protein
MECISVSVFDSVQTNAVSQGMVRLAIQSAHSEQDASLFSSCTN